MRLLLPILFVVFFDAVSCTSQTEKGTRSEVRITFFVVTKVIDGDTFWVDDGSPNGQKIRLIGIDAPESRKTGRKEIQFFGGEAKAYLKSLLEGNKVRLEFDAGRKDRYGRTLAYAYLEDGTFVNAELIKEGYAMALTIPPNVKFAEQFAKLQDQARQGKKGLWSGGQRAY